MPIIDFIPREGERRAIVGQTGSGKTNFALWLLDKIDTAPWIIYDTKTEPKFESLRRSIVVSDFSEIEPHLENPELDYVIFRPDAILATDVEALDEMLLHHLENWRGVGAYVDELYHFHRSGRAGPGLNGIFTRGRSRGITFLGGSQRPSWVSQFFFSEAQGAYVFRIKKRKDRISLSDAFPGFEELPPAPKHHFYYHHDSDDGAPVLMKPVPLVDPANSGYTDSVEPPAGAQDVVTAPGHAWIGPRRFFEIHWGSEPR